MSDPMVTVGEGSEPAPDPLAQPDGTEEAPSIGHPLDPDPTLTRHIFHTFDDGRVLATDAHATLYVGELVPFDPETETPAHVENWQRVTTLSTESPLV